MLNHTRAPQTVNTPLLMPQLYFLFLPPKLAPSPPSVLRSSTFFAPPAFCRLGASGQKPPHCPALHFSSERKRERTAPENRSAAHRPAKTLTQVSQRKGTIFLSNFPSLLVFSVLPCGPLVSFFGVFRRRDGGVNFSTWTDNITITTTTTTEAGNTDGSSFTSSEPLPMTTSGTMRTPSIKTALPSPSAGPTLTSSRSTRRLRGSGKGPQSPGLFATISSGKGPQSPGLFATISSGRRRGGSGAGFDTAEPTSPKVTCIGQVRVKTGRKMMRKKKKKKVAAVLNGSRSGRADSIGYRRSAGVQGGICDAVRAFGSELNCFLLCGAGVGGGRSSVCCSRSDRDKAEGGGGGGKRAATGVGSACGAAFARWIVATQDGGRKRGEMGVENDAATGTAAALFEEESDEELVEERRFRRGIRALELLADQLQKGGGFPEEEGFDGEAPACAPPKNALLLMRCGADPVKLSALENRFKEAKMEGDEEDVVITAGDGADGGAGATAYTRQVDHNLAEGWPPLQQKPEHHDGNKSALEGVTRESLPKLDDDEKEEAAHARNLEGGGDFTVAFSEEHGPQGVEEEEEIEKPHEAAETNAREEDDDDADEEENRVVLVESADDSEADKENKEVLRFPDKTEKLVRRDLLLAGGEMQGGRWSFSKDRELLSVDGGVRRHSFSTEGARRSSSFREKELIRRSSFSHQGCDSVRRSSSLSSSEQRDKDGAGRRYSDRRSISSKEKDPRRWRSVEESTRKQSTGAESGATAAATTGGTQEVAADRRKGEQVGSQNKDLPDCLRLMMYEPKLSMEISQETWVCTDDFQRCKPHRHRPQQQQGRSSAPKPASNVEEEEQEDEEEEQAAAAAAAEVVEEEEMKPPLEVVPEEEGAAAAAAQSNRNTTTNEDVSKKKQPTLLTTTPTTEATTVQAAPPPPVAAAQPPRFPPKPPSAPPELLSKSSAERRLDSATTAAIAAAALGPLVLTRCKSEPLRTSPRLLLPEDYCFWKSHHHQHALGAAGIGFGF